MLAGASKEGLGAGPGLHVGGGSRVETVARRLLLPGSVRRGSLFCHPHDGRGRLETCARISGEMSK
jgi:hypothetical protein